MPLKKELKVEVVEQFKTHEGDTGSSVVQIALLTKRIQQLVDHLKKNNKDNHSRYGLLMMVGQRRRLLNYLQRTDAKRFEEITAKLGLK